MKNKEFIAQAKSLNGEFNTRPADRPALIGRVRELVNNYNRANGFVEKNVRALLEEMLGLEFKKKNRFRSKRYSL